ncbi:MAG TPA: DinB family protein [Chitinophagaceae bacterium]|nr:DinB family protein [Chitinophagaceae bacterium]
MITNFIAELQHESANTRKMLEKVPNDKLSWKPHEKSMSLGRLASHIAQIPMWFERILTADEFDFSKSAYKTVPAGSVSEILEQFDDKINKSLQLLGDTSDEKLDQAFTLRNADKIYFTLPKKVMLRNFSYNHVYHHRGQLSVYLRLLGIPVPGMYGPSADESM